MGGDAGGGNLIGRLRADAAKLRDAGNPEAEIAADLDEEAADRIEALERALADQLAGCPGCDGGGWATTPLVFDIRKVAVPCPRCAAARAVLDRKGVAGG